jgi:hypothetical protein
MARAPLELVPPFSVAAYSGSGLTMREYARSYPSDFAFRLLGRLAVVIFFYGGIGLTIAMFLRRPGRMSELLVFISPLVYTIVVQLPTAFEQRYMATGAWVLVLPWALAIDRAGTAIAQRYGRPRTLAS